MNDPGWINEVSRICIIYFLPALVLPFKRFGDVHQRSPISAYAHSCSSHVSKPFGVCRC